MHIPELDFQSDQLLIDTSFFFFSDILGWSSFPLEKKKTVQEQKGSKMLSWQCNCYPKSWSLPSASTTARREGNILRYQILGNMLQDLQLRCYSIHDLQLAWCFMVLFPFLPHLGVKLLFMIKDPNLSPHTHTYYETNWALVYLYNVCRSNGLLIQIIHAVWLATVL